MLLAKKSFHEGSDPEGVSDRAYEAEEKHGR